MENQEKKKSDSHDDRVADGSTYSSPSQSYSPPRLAQTTSPPPRSPVESPASSDLSHRTSLSHGSSHGEDNRPGSPPMDPPSPQPQRQPVMNRFVWDEPEAVTKVDPAAGDGFFGGGVEGGRGSRRARQSLPTIRRVEREATVKKAALGCRVLGLLFCLISLSVMASDKNKGWALDSFYRYEEFRYCLTVNVLGFVYSAAQACDLAYQLATSKYVVRNQIRYYFDFATDQMLSYLLISASSTAATRVEDWQSNWGQDKFPQMAGASVVLSFLAFVAFAANSLLSGYALCTFRST